MAFAVRLFVVRHQKATASIIFTISAEIGKHAKIKGNYSADKLEQIVIDALQEYLTQDKINVIT